MAPSGSTVTPAGPVLVLCGLAMLVVGIVALAGEFDTTIPRSGGGTVRATSGGGGAHHAAVAASQPTSETRALWTAAKSGNVPMLLAALLGGADLEAKDYTVPNNVQVNPWMPADAAGMTALLKAAFWGQELAVEALVRAGAALEVTDMNGMTALMHAAAQGRHHLCQALQTRRERLPNDIFTAAEMAKLRQCRITAIHASHLAVVEALVRAGANANAAIKDNGATVLMIAVAHLNEPRVAAAIVEALARAGAHLDATDNFGWTALMTATDNNQVDSVAALLKAGADTEIKAKLNYAGMTALEIAKKTGHNAIVITIEKMLQSKQLAIKQLGIPDTRPGWDTGRGGKDFTLYKSMGTYYCTHYHKFTRHDTLTDWQDHHHYRPDPYTACQRACDAIPTCNAFGLGKDKCATYEGCISSAPRKQNWGDYFFMNTRN